MIRIRKTDVVGALAAAGCVWLYCSDPMEGQVKPHPGSVSQEQPVSEQEFEESEFSKENLSLQKAEKERERERALLDQILRGKNAVSQNQN